jgi:hypothetical protein
VRCSTKLSYLGTADDCIGQGDPPVNLVEKKAWRRETRARGSRQQGSRKTLVGGDGSETTLTDSLRLIV